MMLSDVAQKLFYDEKSYEDGIVCCMEFALVFGMVSERGIMLRMK